MRKILTSTKIRAGVVYVFFALAGCLLMWNLLGEKTMAINSVPTSVHIIEVVCGDGIRVGEEECDTNDFGGETCESLEYARGTLTCNSNCTFNTVSCVPDTPSNPSPVGSSGGGSPTKIIKQLSDVEIKERVSRINLNNDGRIDVADLSILLFFYGKSGQGLERYDFNSDGRVNIVDISILLYYWEFFA